MNIRVYANGKTENNGPLGVRGGQVAVGGDLVNSGKVKVFEGGKLEVEKNVLNHGEILVNDPEKFKEIIIAALSTTGEVAKLGTEFLKKIGLMK